MFRKRLGQSVSVMASLLFRNRQISASLYLYLYLFLYLYLYLYFYLWGQACCLDTGTSLLPKHKAQLKFSQDLRSASNYLRSLRSVLTCFARDWCKVYLSGQAWCLDTGTSQKEDQWSANCCKIESNMKPRWICNKSFAFLTLSFNAFCKRVGQSISLMLRHKHIFAAQTPSSALQLQLQATLDRGSNNLPSLCSLWTCFARECAKYICQGKPDV